MLRLLPVPLVLTVFLFLGGPPCTNVPTLIAATRSLDNGSLCLCALSPSPPQQLNNASLQAAPTAEPVDQAAQEENDDLVSVQMVVFALAVAAAVIGLLGYLLRRVLGLEHMPPPDDAPPHH